MELKAIERNHKQTQASEAITMRLGRCVSVGVSLALAVRALIWGGAGPLAAARAGTATFDELVALAACVIAFGLLAWVGMALVVTALGALPGAFGAASSRLGSRVAPGLAGRMARLALGLSLTAGPVSACTPALAGDSGLPGVGRIGEVIEPGPMGAGDAGATFAGETPLIATPPAELPLAENPLVETPPTDRDAAEEPLADASPAAAEPTPTPAAGLTTEPTRDHRPADEVVVQRGDTLWAIAARHLGTDATEAAIAEEWPRWYAANRGVIGDDPDLILPGTILRPPTDR